MITQFSEIITSNTQVFSPNTDLLSVIIPILVATGLMLLIANVYIKTHNTIYYNSNFAQTLVILGVVATTIIALVDNNLARAFSLAGVLSIVRFRSAVQDSKDIAFVFFVMVTGLACGSHAYLMASIFVFLVCVLIYALDKTKFGRKDDNYKILKITAPENLPLHESIGEILKIHFLQSDLIRVKLTGMGTHYEYTYQVKPRKIKIDEKKLIDELRIKNNNFNITYYSPFAEETWSQ